MNTSNELLETAKTSTCSKTLHNLAQSSSSSVRRAVARNLHTLSDTLDTLANDPVLNVSFMATKNPRCLVKREFLDISNPCIYCEKDERELVCTNCPTLKEFYK